MNKKAQMQMMETISVLFVFIILIAIGFIFYANVLKGSMDITKREHSELQSIELSSIASSMPELQCTEDNIAKENCVDLLKLNVSADVIKENQFLYFDMLGYSDITIEEIFPGERTFTVYSNPPPDYKQKLPNFVPILIKEPGKGYSFGIMNVVLYTR